MSVTTEVLKTPTVSEGLRPYRITVEVYEPIVASGAFGDKSSIFLWKGQLVEKIPELTKGRPHVYAVNRLDKLLGALLPTGYFVEQDRPMALRDFSVTEPDLKVVRGAEKDYLRRSPAATECPLVIEVSDSSSKFDTGEVLREYADGLVSVYWVVNLNECQIEVYSEPNPSGVTYNRRDVFGTNDSVPLILDGRGVGRLPVSEVLP